MELALFVYLASIIQGLDDLFFALTLVSLLTVVAMTLMSITISAEAWDPDTQGISSHNLTMEQRMEASKRGSAVLTRFRRKIAIPVICVMFFGTLTALTPDNEKSVYLIGGAWALQTVGEKTVNSETADLAVKAVNAKLKAYVEEATATQTMEKR